jgi:hypothetical protein
VSDARETTRPQVISATEHRTETHHNLEQARFKAGHCVIESLAKLIVTEVGIGEWVSSPGTCSAVFGAANGWGSWPPIVTRPEEDVSRT